MKQDNLIPFPVSDTVDAVCLTSTILSLYTIYDYKFDQSHRNVYFKFIPPVTRSLYEHFFKLFPIISGCLFKSVSVCDTI